MLIEMRKINSQSGLEFRVEFNDVLEECKVNCLSVTGYDALLKTEIRQAMDPLNLKIVRIGSEYIVYKCPVNKKDKVIKRIKEC